MTSRAAFPAAESHLVTVGGVRGATVMTGAPLRSAAHWVLPEELHAGVPKKILVTGGNAGIGFALCTQLAAKGCHVYLCARSVERGEAAVAAIREETPDAKVELVQCDTADDASVAAAAAAVKASLRGETLYAIVNNAGVNRGDPADIINVNVHGPKRVCEAFAPLWQSAGGRVVNVGELLTAPGGWVSCSLPLSTPPGTPPLAATRRCGPSVGHQSPSRPSHTAPGVLTHTATCTCVTGSGGGPSFVAKHPQHRELLCFYYTTWEQLEALLETEPWSDGASLRRKQGPFGRLARAPSMKRLHDWPRTAKASGAALGLALPLRAPVLESDLTELSAALVSTQAPTPGRPTSRRPSGRRTAARRRASTCTRACSRGSAPTRSAPPVRHCMLRVDLCPCTLETSDDAARTLFAPYRAPRIVPSPRHRCTELLTPRLRPIHRALAPSRPRTRAVSPGFIATGMTEGYGASKPPEEGTVSTLLALWADPHGQSGVLAGP